jgi:phage gp46-like protein
MNIQQGDVIIFQSLDGGEIEINNGFIEMNGGLQTAVYLSLFGGNDEDNKTSNQEFNKSWWGNSNEDEINKYRSETQYLLKSLVATSSNLRKLELTAKRDLNWMIESKLASEINISASIPTVNMVKLTIEINQNQFEFIENWRNT